MVEKVDIIAFGPHPDDVELGCGGLLAKEVSLGYKVGIVDMTQGEMGTNGSIEERLVEAQKAGEILGATWRINLAIPDRNIAINDENLAKVVTVIRQARPTYILFPYGEDRHPDHVNTHNLLNEAYFSAGLRKYLPELEAYRPQGVLNYFLNKTPEPSFVVDTSDFFELKQASVLAHQSQFGRPNLAIQALFGNRKVLEAVECRDKMMGGQVAARYGEGFINHTKLKIADPMKLWKEG